MMQAHKEVTFESEIEEYLVSHGYVSGHAEDYSKELALDPSHVISFLQATQSSKWAKLTTIHGDQVRELFLRRLCKELEARGTLDVLRHGVTDYGVTFEMMIAKPAHGMSPERVALYEQNRLQ